MRAHLISFTLVLGLAIATPALAADAPSDSGTAIHLTQTARKTVARDFVRARLRIEADGADPAKVQAEINRRMAEALATVKAEAAVKAETKGYWIFQESPPDKPARWRASQSLELTGKDFLAALALVGKLQAAGLLVEGIEFEVSPEALRAIEDELTAQALAELRARADTIAADLKTSVARYKSLSVGNATTQQFRAPMPMMAAKSAMSSAAPPPVAEPGESDVMVNVDAEVIMAPASP